jgi:hypothetical protein
MRRYWNLKKKALDRSLYRTFFGTVCWPAVRQSTQWTNGTETDSHTETCSGIYVTSFYICLYLRQLLIHQDFHRRTHVSVATSAVMYSPERKKNESVQKVTWWTERSLYSIYFEDWGSSYQTKRYTHSASSRTSFPESNTV